MKLNTRFFGEIDYEQEETLTFPNGLFGFEEEKSFLLITFPADGFSTLFCFQSVLTPELAFLAMDPFHLAADYTPVLQEEELSTFGVKQSEDLFYYVLCAAKNPISSSTVNMRCPIAVCEETRTAYQVILEDCPYTMRQALSDFAGGKEEPPC